MQYMTASKLHMKSFIGSRVYGASQRFGGWMIKTEPEEADGVRPSERVLSMWRHGEAAVRAVRSTMCPVDDRLAWQQDVSWFCRLRIRGQNRSIKVRRALKEVEPSPPGVWWRAIDEEMHGHDRHEAYDLSNSYSSYCQKAGEIRGNRFLY